MRELHVNTITDAIAKISITANTLLNPDIEKALSDGLTQETSGLGQTVLRCLLENADMARTQNMAICQDTGMAIVFMEIGQDVHLVGGDLTDAVNAGIRRGYREGYLRNSVVEDPIQRKNTGDNTPAVIHMSIVPGNEVKIDLAPKGFGSENMSALCMLKPSDGLDGVKKFILDSISKAGANPCPPIVIGVGIGGSMEKAALIAKHALLRPIDQRSNIDYVRELEEYLLTEINHMGIGPAGLGGRITAIGVNVEVFPTHIAGLPVAVNVSCHATRHASVVL